MTSAAGGVGLATVELARRLGAARVLAACGTAEKLALAASAPAIVSGHSTLSAHSHLLCPANHRCLSPQVGAARRRAWCTGAWTVAPSALGSRRWRLLYLPPPGNLTPPTSLLHPTRTPICPHSRSLYPLPAPEPGLPSHPTYRSPHCIPRRWRAMPASTW